MRMLGLAVFSSIVLASLGAFSAEVKRVDEEGMGLVIGSIQTKGNRVISSAEILARVRSRVGQVFDPATAVEDAKRIAELNGVQYGYYSTAKVADKIELTFVVVEKNIVRSVAFVGNRKYKTKELRKKLDVKIGDYLDAVLAESGRRTLTEFYRKNGFAFVQIGFDEQLLSLGQLVYRIQEGPRVKIESMGFSGNKVLKTRELKKVLKTEQKKWFLWPSYYNEDEHGADVIRLQDVYQQRGFLDAKIMLQRQFNEDKSKVRLTFAIEEGPVNHHIRAKPCAGADFNPFFNNTVGPHYHTLTQLNPISNYRTWMHLSHFILLSLPKSP